ncbi:thioesterase superfamily protein [Nocardioides albertanoniae]|uniref:Thioesterase superfamily protein n=1 Tax=Nocardioides albertanoniae TaxID=1175486 RepID=A0A543AAV8_9ACTN|nr:thioesterase family protein [Nocardioides albertanoniae]TQL69742.1 thioesterase superfamily protein [Nocardioides albertanoniae]
MGESAQSASGQAEFDRDIDVRRTDATTYAADLAPGWVVGGGVNGGYLLSVIANAVSQHLPRHPDPIVVSAFYTSASVPGAAQVRIDVKRDSGSLAIVSAELWQGDDLRLTTTATYADLDGLHAKANPLERVTLIEPELPPREECVVTHSAPDEVKSFVPMLERFDMLVPPEQFVWAGGEGSGKGTFSAWFRLKDRDADPISLLQVLDALPPVTYDLGMPGWAPTLELTCHVRHKPAPGWLKVTHTSRNLSGGMFEEDCEVWDSEGRLVGQARQLARVPRA